MATPCNIAIAINGGYRSIYCHHDGYPSYMLPMLKNNYNTFEKAEALVNEGDASSVQAKLAPVDPIAHSEPNFPHEKDVCVFYCRDMHEPYSRVAPIFGTKQSTVQPHEFTYIFEDGKWKAYNRNGDVIAE